MKKTYKELLEEYKKLKKEYLATFDEKTLQEIINVIEQMLEIEKQVFNNFTNEKNTRVKHTSTNC